MFCLPLDLIWQAGKYYDCTKYLRKINEKTIRRPGGIFHCEL